MDRTAFLDSAEKSAAIDQQGMLAVTAKTPEMLLEALTLSCRPALKKGKKVKQILVVGMGGSAIAGNIISDLVWDKAKLPVYVNRGYKLPAFVGSETLIFALSYSGDTEETLAAVKQAGNLSAKVICVTSGGKLKGLAESKGYPLWLIPAGYQPRAALPYLLVPLLTSLEQLGLPSAKRQELEATAALLQKLKNEYGPTTQGRGNPVKQLAVKLVGKIPVIMAVRGTSEAAGLRLKTQLNENSKTTALFNVFPELNHNEMVNLAALERGRHNFALIFLRSESDPERVKKRIEITKSLLGGQLGGANEIQAQGKTVLARIMSLVFLGDLLSIYLAILQGVDPTPVEVIARLKKELNR